ncbi:MAG: histidine kinase [Candidatus Cloacimonetes bacterium]|nr:histidine kinase [Candidatus Cloacimonadota bacterium]
MKKNLILFLLTFTALNAGLIQPDSVHFFIGDENEYLEQIPWRNISEIGQTDMINNKAIYLRIHFDKIDIPQPILSFNAMTWAFSVYADNKLIYSYQHDKKENSKFYRDYLIHLSDNNFKYLYIVIERENFDKIALLQNIEIGDLESIQLSILEKQKHELRKTVVASILFFVALIAFFAFFIRWKTKDFAFLSFGFFCFTSAIDHSFPYFFYNIFNLTPALGTSLNVLNDLLIPVGMLALLDQILFPGKKTIISFLWKFQLCFTAIVAMLIIFYYVPSFVILTYWLLQISYTLIVLVVVLKSPKTKKYRNRYTVTGFLLFIALIMYELLIDFFYVGVDYLYGFGIISLVIVLIYLLIEHYRNTENKMWRYSLELELNRNLLLKFEQENLKTQFETLKKQLNPHFLFNSFSTLMSLIEEDKHQAVTFVEEMSNVYRYILQNEGKELLKLEDEVEFIYSYSFLLKKRFGQNFNLSIALPKDVLQKNCLPTLTLQLLIENAVKHNKVSSRYPLQVKIYTENGYLVSENNLNEKKTILSTGVGLKNIRQRYAYFTDKTIEIIHDDSKFVIKVPLLKCEHNKIVHINQ